MTHALKLCSEILKFLGIFDMARLIRNSMRAFISPRLVKFQENKIRSWCFKFDDLNLELEEAIEILKATAQSFGKSEISAFLQYSLLAVLGLGSHYHARIALGHSATSPSTFVPTT